MADDRDTLPDDLTRVESHATRTSAGRIAALGAEVDLSQMSHELRTPLNAILGFSEALRDGIIGELSEKQRSVVGDIFRSGKRLLAVVDLLNLSAVASRRALGRGSPSVDATSAGPRLSVPQIHGRPVRILVVDDESANSEVLEILLSWEGFLVACAPSGEDALVRLVANPPDLILLDVMMPGIDGYEVATRIKADPNARHIPIIIFTAAAKGAETRGRASGADDVIAKPIDRVVLVEHVKTVLRHAYDDYREQVLHTHQERDLDGLCPG